MNDGLEVALRRLASDSDPHLLADVEHQVLSRVSGYRFVTSDVLMLLSALTVAGSLALGIAAGWFHVGSDQQDIAPLVAAHPLAPSSLLADSE